MYTEGFDQLFKINKNLTTPLNDATRLAAEICRRNAQKNLELVGENVLLFTNQLKRLSEIRQPQDLLYLQKNAMTEGLAIGMDTLQKVINLSMENIASMTKLYETVKAPATSLVAKVARTADAQIKKTVTRKTKTTVKKSRGKKAQRKK
ncbi:MAG: phasin family protein [Gammaproteobacteria bacterium]|nr:phasin family protein [Gammaproteobacteria bacterium]